MVEQQLLGLLPCARGLGMGQRVPGCRQAGGRTGRLLTL